MHILCLTMIRMRFGIGPDPEHVASTATGSTACYLFVQIFVQDPGGLDKQSAILQNIHGPLMVYCRICTILKRHSMLDCIFLHALRISGHLKVSSLEES